MSAYVPINSNTNRTTVVFHLSAEVSVCNGITYVTFYLQNCILKTGNDDCRRDKSCKNGKCVSLCNGACGINARCEVTPQRTVTCQCYYGYVGDPSVYCHPIPPSDLCRTRCGSNTNCRIFNGIPYCYCKPGFIVSIFTKGFN